MNKVLLTGRLTRDPEMRSLASGKNVTTFTVASNEFIGGGKEKAEYHPVVTWDRLAEIAGTYLGKGQQVAIEGRLQTRSWDDDTRPAALEDRDRRHPRRDAVRPAQEGLRGPAGGRLAWRPRPRPRRRRRTEPTPARPAIAGPPSRSTEADEEVVAA